MKDYFDLKAKLTRNPGYQPSGIGDPFAAVVEKNAAKILAGKQYASLLLAVPDQDVDENFADNDLLDNGALNESVRNDLLDPNSKSTPAQKLETMKYALEDLRGKFLMDRGRTDRYPNKHDILRHSGELMRLYELSLRADEIIADVKSWKNVPQYGERNREAVLETLQAIKSQKHFFEDELRQMECLTDPTIRALDLDLSDTDTLRQLAAWGDAFAAGKTPEVAGKCGLPDDFTITDAFRETCRISSERWKARAAAEVEAASSMLYDILPEPKNSANLKMRSTKHPDQILPFDAAKAQELLLGMDDDDDLQIYDETDETRALNLKNNGKREWYAYRSQVDGNEPSFRPVDLPEEPGILDRILDWIVRFFGGERNEEIRAYDEAKASLKNISDKLTEIQKQAAENDILLDKDPGYVKMLAEQKAAERKWDDAVQSEYGSFMKEWDKFEPNQKKQYMAQYQEYLHKKEKWEKSPEVLRQKARMTRNRSAKTYLEREERLLRIEKEDKEQYFGTIEKYKDAFLDWEIMHSRNMTENLVGLDYKLIPYLGKSDKELYNPTDDELHDTRAMIEPLISVYGKEAIFKAFGPAYTPFLNEEDLQSETKHFPQSVITKPHSAEEEQLSDLHGKNFEANLGDHLIDHTIRRDFGSEIPQPEGEEMQNAFSDIRDYYMGNDRFHLKLSKSLKSDDPKLVEDLEARHEDFYKSMKDRVMKKADHLLAVAKNRVKLCNMSFELDMLCSELDKNTCFSNKHGPDPNKYGEEYWGRLTPEGKQARAERAIKLQKNLTDLRKKLGVEPAALRKNEKTKVPLQSYIPSSNLQKENSGSVLTF